MTRLAFLGGRRRVVERYFGTSQSQFINNLTGNTKIMRHVRQVTQSRDPKNLATWTLETFDEAFSYYVHEIYDTNDHPALFQSPREAYIQGIENNGTRPMRFIPFDQSFMTLTLPTTDRGQAKVDNVQGIKVNNIHYWHNDFRDATVAGSKVEVRYDPWDVSRVMTYVKGRWVECFSEYRNKLAGYSEKAIQVATSELRQKWKNHNGKGQFSLTSKRLAEYIASVEGQQALEMQLDKDIAQGQVTSKRKIGARPGEFMDTSNGAGVNNVVPLRAQETSAKPAKSEYKNVVPEVYDEF